MASSPPDPAQAHDACVSFFSIDELVTIFLENAPPLVLLNCQRVCQKWNFIIAISPLIQQNLFLAPSNDTNQEPRLNPLLWQHFGPVLATPTSPHHSSPQTTYADLHHLPIARDGLTLTAPSRQSFTRRDASWREMLICQPPITRLDWWHTWQVSENWLRPPDEDWGRRGWGHQDLNNHPLTLGTLWDLLESRLIRGCSAQIHYFPSGIAPSEDSTSTALERDWASDVGNQLRGFTGRLPRVRLTTYQEWEQRPRANEMFDFGEERWRVGNGVERRGHDYDGDGFNVLRQDCRWDFGEQRWSRCEEFRWAEIDGESSGSG